MVKTVLLFGGVGVERGYAPPKKIIGVLGPIDPWKWSVTMVHFRY